MSPYIEDKSESDPHFRHRPHDRPGACRVGVVESENRPQRGQFLPDLQAHSLAKAIQTSVYERFGILLQPEPVVV